MKKKFVDDNALKRYNQKLFEYANGNILPSNMSTDTDGLFVTDNNLNVIAKYDKEGFDVAKLSTHAKSLLAKDYANVIVATTRKKTLLENLSADENIVTFYKDLDWETWLCKGKNYLKPSYNSDKVVQGVTINSDYYNRVVLNGTATGTDMVAYDNRRIPLEMLGKPITIAAIGCAQVFVMIQNTDVNKNRKIYAHGGSNAPVLTNIPLQEGDYNIIVKIVKGVESGVVYNNKHIWVGLYMKDNGMPFKANSGDIVRGAIFDGLYYPITMTYYADTKRYIDENGVGGWITPEQYGATGDGVANDTEALQACIDAAVADNLIVKGFGVYKLSKTIVMDSNYKNIFLNKLVYNGDSCAFRVSGKGHEIEIREIVSSNIGMEATHSNFANLLQENHFVIGRIESQSHCIHEYTVGYVDGDISTWRLAYGNRWDINRLVSKTGHCVYIHHTYEDAAFFINSVKAESNWSFNTSGTFRLYNTEMEDTYAGFITSDFVLAINVRMIEMTNHAKPKSEDPTQRGWIAKLKDVATIKFVCREFDLFPDLIDTSEVRDFDPNIYRQSYYYYYKIGESGGNFRLGEQKYTGTCDIFVYGKRIVTVPRRKICRSFNGDTDLEKPQITPPYMFDIKGSCTIRLGASYLPVGMNEFIVKQSDNAKGVFIDTYERTAFDGNLYGAGMYRVAAIDNFNEDNRFLACYEDNFNWIVTKIN